MQELQEMLVDQLKDAHSAERQAIQLMKRTLKKVSAPELRQGIEAHIAQSEEQRERVEQALALMDAKAGRTVCEAMRGLSEEAQHEMDEHDEGPICDIVIVASQQRVEHYEIAAYGTMAELARAIGADDAAELLGRTLEEEKAQDQLLTQCTRETLLPAAKELNGDEEEEGEEEDDEDEDEDEDEDAEDEEKAAAPAKPAPAKPAPAPAGARKRA